MKNQRITHALEPIPVIATLRWDQEIVVDVLGLALAWTHNAVKVRWTAGYALRADWLPAYEVRRAPPDWPRVQHESTAATPPNRGLRRPSPPP